MPESMESKLDFRANGKLLITGEYLVIDGAKALAIPTVLGQDLSCKRNDNGVISWNATDVNGLWFEAEFKSDSIEILASSNEGTALFIQSLLKSALELCNENPFLSGAVIITRLDFDRFLGLGSSSTIIALVASMYGIDKYKLHSKVSKGSGYDIACAGVSYPILFRRTDKHNAVFSPAPFNPEFSNSLYFIYLGNKQDTNREINRYKELNKFELQKQIQEVSEITNKIIEVKEIATFASLIERHEQILSAVLQTKTIQERLFNDFNGFIKSLGAWGGDFVLAGTTSNKAYVKDYFEEKGIRVIYPYDDLVLKQKATINDEISIRF
jgi:mevalonate kinase